MASAKATAVLATAVAQAKTPTLDKLFATCPYTWLKAHGTAVGLPTDDDMGNSEVGHNALGCGQIYSQGAKLVGQSLSKPAAMFAVRAPGRTADEQLPGKSARRCTFWACCPTAMCTPTSAHLIAMLPPCPAAGQSAPMLLPHPARRAAMCPATSALDLCGRSWSQALRSLPARRRL